MIEETGVVQKTEGVMASVLVQKRGACEGCTSTGTCEVTHDGMVIEAINPVQAKPGQTVSIIISPISYLKGTMLVYGFPMIALIAGAIIGKNIGERFFGSASSDLAAAIAGFTAFIAAFLFARIWSRKAESKTENKPIIEKIIS
jgi:sigma-E factor negative regulatory protein RseC